MAIENEEENKGGDESELIECPECGRMCKGNVGLRAHMRKHDKSSKGKPKPKKTAKSSEDIDEDLNYIIEKWSIETIEKIAQDRSLTVNMVKKLATSIRKETDGKLCPNIKVTHESRIKNVLERLRKEGKIC